MLIQVYMFAFCMHAMGFCIIESILGRLISDFNKMRRMNNMMKSRTYSSVYVSLKFNALNVKQIPSSVIIGIRRSILCSSFCCHIHSNIKSIFENLQVNPMSSIVSKIESSANVSLYSIESGSCVHKWANTFSNLRLNK